MNRPQRRRIAIIGGGTAGWMTAALAQQRYAHEDVDIVVVDAASIPPIGVGEATVPIIDEYMQLLGLDEEQWMPPSEATYKLGIQFIRWSTHPDRRVWFHPFWSRDDNEPDAEARVERWLASRGGGGHEPRVDEHYLGSRLSAAHVAPRSRRPPVHRLIAGQPLAYHLRSHAFAEFLRDRCITRGVLHRVEEVTAVAVLDGDAGIDHLETSSGRIEADLFIDCTGFRRLLLGKLGPGHRSYADELLCNRACVAVVGHDGTRLANYTTIHAMRAGWR
ncbi:MAG: FAD-dependent oxidoreductase, partial [Acidimicrobiia bacterium]